MGFDRNVPSWARHMLLISTGPYQTDSLSRFSCSSLKLRCYQAAVTLFSASFAMAKYAWLMTLIFQTPDEGIQTCPSMRSRIYLLVQNFCVIVLQPTAQTRTRRSFLVLARYEVPFFKLGYFKTATNSPPTSLPRRTIIRFFRLIRHSA